jgi:hypothetical protein
MPRLLAPGRKTPALSVVTWTGAWVTETIHQPYTMKTLSISNFTLTDQLASSWRLRHIEWVGDQSVVHRSKLWGQLDAILF